MSQTYWRERQLNSRLTTTFFIIVAALAFVLSVRYWPDRTASHRAGRALTEREIARLFPCSYYPGQASALPMVELLARHADTVALARLDTFESGGFDKPDISWTALLRTCRTLKGRGEPVYLLPIQGPERNFGAGAEGRLFILFTRESGGELLWALEPWLPENEDIASGA
jgi:hypothetical protein